MSLSIRIAQIDESPLVLSMLLELLVELGEDRNSLDHIDESLVRRLLQSSVTTAYFAELDGEPVGLMTLTESQAVYAGGSYGTIDELYVSPGHRSRNIGAALIAEAKRVSAVKQWKRLVVTAPPEARWKRSVHFYEQNGFKFTGPKLKFKVDNS